MALGLLLQRRWRRSGWSLFFVSLLSLFLVSLPIVTKALMAPLQQQAVLDVNQLPDDAPSIMVVLSGGRADRHAEYQADSIGPLSLQRVRYAAWLDRRMQIPILLSGGRVDPDEERAEAHLMQDTLQKEFLLKAEFVEGESRNTFENALFSAKLLKQLNLPRIYLVTHAWHMPRAKRCFESQGIEVVPAPTAFYGKEKLSLRDFIPSAKAVQYSYFALHEYLGLLWYRLRYY